MPARTFSCKFNFDDLSGHRHNALAACCLKLIPLFFCLIFTDKIWAEGSKELTANGGNRAYLYSSQQANLSFPFPTYGTVKVYAKAGETLNLGSSAQGFSLGTINLRAPNGATYTSGTSTTIGLIANRSQELAGPSPNAGGYTPYTHTVLAGEDGVWEVDFMSPSGGNGATSNPNPIAASAAWTQPSGQYVTAFDISVRNTANTTFLTGRVYTNIFVGILGAFDVGFNAIFYILTKDGYQYTLNNNGQAGNGFSFFVNNKGFRTTAGIPSYKSIDNINSPNIQDPRVADTQSDVTHKIFFNTPAADLPATANTPGSGITWLLTAPIIATMTNVSFTGAEGTANQAGTSPLGSNISFTTNKNGTYVINIDVNKNGVFTDAIDRKLTGIANAGVNQVAWDGLDGQGNKVPASTVSFPLSVTTILNGGEVHFPFFDVERNINGILLTRSNGDNSPDNTVYWDDSPINQTASTPSNPVTNTNGINSLINGHKWGTAGADNSDFGNEKGLDTWAYISSSPLVSSLTFQLKESDLEVQSVDSSPACVGETVAYTVAVKNNGPSDVTGSHFAFNYPTGLSNVVVSSVQTSGTSVVTNEVITGTQYTSLLDMSNGAIRKFTIAGKLTALPTGGKLNTTASMLRPADVTDPDATNPDAAPPTDATAECNSAPSGVGCNNIKTSSVQIAIAPGAGPNQFLRQFAIPTLTANGAGTWAQVGNTPTTATITNPNNPTTTVTGLSALGNYVFVFTNIAGCTDSVTIAITLSGMAEITIPNIFTPNGDGKNDVFVIDGLGNFPGSQLIIYNRWGNEVYRADNYLNNWDGSGLAQGTYYYLLNRHDSAGQVVPFKGWVYIKR